MAKVDLFNYRMDHFERATELNALREAFKNVRRNGGAPGIDGVSVSEFEKILEEELFQLQQEVRSWKYRPKPVRSVEIPKPNGGVRQLGIPCVRDRVLQAALKAELEPILDPGFSDNSYGFRPKRNQRQAVEAAKQIVASGKEHVVDIDLAKFFDRIHHDRLINQLGQKIQDKRVLRLIGILLRGGIMKDGMTQATREGATQGSPLSPLLSNVVLDELDRELETRGLEFCRYADDCNIFVGSQKAGKRVMQSITKFIEKRLKLKVNTEKSRVAMSRAVKFLGLTIIAGTIAISSASMKKAIETVKALTPMRTHNSIEASVDRINSWYMGWAGYYRMTQYPNQLALIEAHVRRRLRARFIGEQKRKAYLVKKLVKRGVSQRAAQRAVYTNRSRWALSNVFAVTKAYPNRWFAETLELEVISTAKSPHWFEIGKRIILT